MRILYINHYAGSLDHGMEFRPFYLSKEWVRQGHEVLIVAASESHIRAKQPDLRGLSEREETIEGVRYLWLKTPKYRGNGLGRIRNILSFLFRLRMRSRSLAARFRPDVVIASSTYPMDVFVAKKIARAAKAKLVFEVHDLWPLSPMEIGGMKKWHPFIVLVQWAEDYAYRTADVVISMLPNAWEYMKTRGLPQAKYFHIPNGVDLQDWRDASVSCPDEIARRIRELKAEGYFVVGYLGGHALSNALDQVISAAKILESQKIAFCLIGAGHEKPRLQQMAAGMKTVFFFPPIKKREVPGCMKLFDLLVLSWKRESLYRFGVSPNKLFDYMASGVPVVQALSAANDPVMDAGCGRTVEAENSTELAAAIEGISKLPPEVRAEMGGRGRAYVEAKHSYRVLAEQFLSHLRNS